MKKPRNTTAEVLANPMLGLLTGMPGGIEASEARGQTELVTSESLPAGFNPHCSDKEIADGRAALERWGFVLGEPFEDDPMFMTVKLPLGWERQATDHDMWSVVVDDKGRERISVFYKAAFYDRSAWMSLVSRYTIEYKTVKDEGDFKDMVVRRMVVDGMKKEMMKMFEGGYQETEALAERFLAGVTENKRDPKHWDE